MRSSFIVHFIYRNYEFVVWGKIMKKVIFILILYPSQQDVIQQKTIVIME